MRKAQSAIHTFSYTQMLLNTFLHDLRELFVSHFRESHPLRQSSATARVTRQCHHFALCSFVSLARVLFFEIVLPLWIGLSSLFSLCLQRLVTARHMLRAAGRAVTSQFFVQHYCW